MDCNCTTCSRGREWLKLESGKLPAVSTDNMALRADDLAPLARLFTSNVDAAQFAGQQSKIAARLDALKSERVTDRFDARDSWAGGD